MQRNLIDVKKTCITGGICGILGIVMLVISFNINPGPAQNAGYQQLVAFGERYYYSILWGAWLQTVAPVFISFFAFTLVHLARAANRLSGWMVLFGCAILMMVSLIEITFYIAVMFKSPEAGVVTCMHLIYAVQHLYFFVAAPATFLSLGVVLLNSKILSRLFGHLAIILAISFAVLGIVYLFDLVLPVWVTAYAGVQALWWLAASVSLLNRVEKITNTLTVSAT